MTSVSNNYSQLPPANMSPDAYAQQYATENNISLDEAKAALKAKYGDPTQPSASIFKSEDSSASSTGASLYSDITTEDLQSVAVESSSEDTGFLSLIKELFGIDTSDKTKNKEKLDPDEVAQKYADKHNITLDEAKEKLAQLYGGPIQQ